MRDRQMDVLKGMGIFFVVLGHMSSPFRDWIYSFHMPLFFFAAGFLRYNSREISWGEFLKKKAKANLVPYVVFWGISVASSFSWNSPRMADFGLLHILGMLLGGGYLAETSDNFPLWFFQLYFIALVAFEWLVRSLSPKQKGVAGILLALGTVWFQTVLPGRPAFHINILPAALVFMLLGYGTKHLLCRNEKLQKLSRNVLLGIVLLILGFVISLPHDTNVAEIRRIWYFLGAYCSVLGFYMIGSLFTKWKIPTYLASRSMYILGLHNLCWGYAYDLTDWIIEKTGLSSSTLETLLVACTTMAVCCLAAEVYFLVKKGISSIFHE